MFQHSISPPAFLIAEDDFLDFQMLDSAIKATGSAFQIIHFETGQDLIDYLKEWTPSQHEIAAIFMDLKMPVMNGLEALEIVRKEKLTRNLPVVMVTASNQPKDIESAYELGANAYLLKAMSLKEFNESVSHMVGFWGKYNQRAPIKRVESRYF